MEMFLYLYIGLLVISWLYIINLDNTNVPFLIYWAVFLFIFLFVFLNFVPLEKISNSF